MPVYFIRSELIDQGKVELKDRLAHHLRDVLRIKEGESLLLVDERSKRYQTTVVESSSGRLVLQIVKEESPPANRTFVHLGIGILKGDKMDWVLQKATELGAARISPLVTERAVARPRTERIAHQHERWIKIVTEAAQQSGRWDLPTVDLPGDLHPFLRQTTGSAEGGVSKLIFWEKAPAIPFRKTLQSGLASSPTTLFLIGPEGGWTESEVEAASGAGFSVVSLGARTLRAETAALAALSIIQYERENQHDGR